MVTQNLAETDEAVVWIEQFEEVDKRDAIFLMNSLELITDAAFRRVLRDLILRKYRQSEAAISLFATREPERVKPQANMSWHKLKRLKPGDYFDNDDKTKRPAAVGNAAGVGSEGPIANLIRDVCAEDSKHFLDHPSLQMMRDTGSRRMVFVDDIIGSGTRMNAFVNWLYSNRFVKSWHSFKYVFFEAISYAGTERGIQNVRSSGRMKSIEVEQHLFPGRATWTPYQLERMRRLCTKYASRTSKPGCALGYKEAFSMLVYPHKCPNTAPVILWQSGPSWEPLFRARPEFGFRVWPSTDLLETRHKELLRSIGQQKLSASEWERYHSTHARLRFVLLAAVAKRIRRADVLSEILARPLSEVRELLKECVHLGWITWDHRVTESGRAELDYARSLGMAPGDTVLLKDSLYFPKTLRAARDHV